MSFLCCVPETSFSSNDLERFQENEANHLDRNRNIQSSGAAWSKGFTLQIKEQGRHDFI